MTKNKGIKPNFIIGGAPKCATSTVYGWLHQHPQVSGSKKKEPFYLMDEGHPQLSDNNYIKYGVDGYGSVFEPDVKNEVLMEGTTQYLYQDTALKFAQNEGVDCKFLFILRDPIKRIYSSFDYARNNLASIDNDVTFSEFIDAARGKSKVKGVSGVNDLLPYELEYGFYSKYLTNWDSLIENGRVKIMVFEDLIRDPLPKMVELCDFIGIQPVFYKDFVFAKKNESLVIKNQGMHRLAKKMRNVIPIGSLKKVIKKIYFEIQSSPKNSNNKPVYEQEEDLLRGIYSKDVRNLSDKYGLDISSWSF